MRLRTGLNDDYTFTQCDEEEEIIAINRQTGHRIRWNGQCWDNHNERSIEK